FPEKRKGWATRSDPTSTQSMLGRSAAGAPVVVLAALVAQAPHQKHPQNKAADVRPPSDAALVDLAQGADAAQELDHEPIAEHQERRYANGEEKEDERNQREYASAGEEHDIGTHHSGDGAAGPDRRQARAPVHHDLG